jgi:hypothetical protein
MADLVEDRLADLFDQIGFIVAGQFHVFLKDKHDIRQPRGVLHAAMGARSALVETQQKRIIVQFKFPPLSACGPLAHFHRDLVQQLSKWLGQRSQCTFNQFPEPRFADSAHHD